MDTTLPVDLAPCGFGQGRAIRRRGCYERAVDLLVPIAVLAVAFVLLLGLFNMLRGGSPAGRST